MAGRVRLQDRPQYPSRSTTGPDPECGCATSALYLAGEGAFPSDRVKILSTGGMLEAARESRANQVLVATEVGMLDRKSVV